MIQQNNYFFVENMILKGITAKYHVKIASKISDFSNNFLHYATSRARLSIE